MKSIFILIPILFLVGCGGGSGGGACLNPVYISWTAPTTNTDGSALTNLAGFKIYWGTSSKNYTQNVAIANPSTTTYTLCNLTPATYYFAMTAYTTTDLVSAYSNEVPYTLTSPQVASIDLTSDKISIFK